MAGTFLSESIRWRLVNLDSLALLLYPLLLGLALGLVHPAYRAWALGAIALLGFVAWLRAYRRYRAIADTPRSRLASAPQGYVELEGRAGLFGPSDGIGFAWTPPAVWVRYAVYRQNDGRHLLVERGQSASVFVLEEGDERALVDPEGAEVIPGRRFHEQRGDFVYRGEYIAPGDRLYVLGHLQTEGGDHHPEEAGQDVAAMLSAWKRDRGFLLAHYDRNGDGQVDVQEWQRARADAERTVEAKRKAEGHLVSPVRHRLQAAHGWRPYLIGTVPEAQLAQRFRRWAVTHLLVFVLAGSAALLLGQYAPPGPERPQRELYLTLPPGSTVELNGQPFRPFALPDREGGPGHAFLRVQVPVGRVTLALTAADGTTHTHVLEVPAAERLLLVSIPTPGAAPVVLP